MLHFQGHPVEIVRRARRRRMSVQISIQGLRVLTDKSIRDSEILDFLQAKSSWLNKHLDKMALFKARFPQPEVKNGSLYPWLGEQKYFQFAKAKNIRPKIRVEDGFLICYILPENETKLELIQKSTAAFYKASAKSYLAARVQYWADLTGLRPSKLSFRAQKCRWGSCNSRKHISLNWKLICQAPSLIDYVIVHELCHLQQLNHSVKFWDLVASFLPHYQEIEPILQNQVHLGEFLKEGA